LKKGAKKHQIWFLNHIWSKLGEAGKKEVETVGKKARLRLSIADCGLWIAELKKGGAPERGRYGRGNAASGP
jgi:hypothetical protein